MKIFHYDEVAAEDVGAGASGVKIRWVINEKTGARNFAMRILDFEPGGYTPRHTHDWEHELYIIEGCGAAFTPDGEKPVKAGDVVFVPGGDEHQFINSSSGLLRLMCLIPLEKKPDGCGC